MLTNRGLLESMRVIGWPIILSTGMSSMEQIRAAVDLLDIENLVITHCTSTYPCPQDELNLRVITSLRKEFDCPIGYSGHEVGLATTVAAVALGASLVERHITLSRAMWGSDQSASVEPHGFARLIKDIRNIEMALGDGVKCVYESEIPAMQRLRPVNGLSETSG
jgi:N-acetylneuraminate synthase